MDHEMGKRQEMDDWNKIRYQIAISDIRWLKEQGWKGIYWILLLFAGITGISFKLNNPILFVILSIFVSIMGVYYIYDLYNSTKLTRTRANLILEENSPQRDRHHTQYLII